MRIYNYIIGICELRPTKMLLLILITVQVPIVQVSCSIVRYRQAQTCIRFAYSVCCNCQPAFLMYFSKINNHGEMLHYYAGGYDTSATMLIFPQPLLSLATNKENQIQTVKFVSNNCVSYNYCIYLYYMLLSLETRQLQENS